MEAYTYFIIAAVLLLVGLGAAASVAATALMAVATIMFAGGVYTGLFAR